MDDKDFRGLGTIGLGSALAQGLAFMIAVYVIVAALVGGGIVGLLWWAFG